MRQGLTLYDVLGVSRDATEAQIRAAFRKLTRENHPDRFRGEDRQKAEERFQVITEAFNVLRNPEAKEKYDQEISQGPTRKVMDAAEIARKLATKGAQALREGKLTEAIDHLKMAIDHDESNGRANYFMGCTMAKVSGREREALRYMERAAQLEPNTPMIKADAAQMFLAAGMKSRAKRLAEETLELDPTNSKATDVLQQIEADENPQADGGGLLSRLRRKG